MSVPGLPPELAELLDRLRRRGLPVTPLEIGRLQHLLAVEGALDDRGDSGRLPVLLAAVLCKDAQGRTLLQREYRTWAAEREGAGPKPPAAPELAPRTGPDDGREAADLVARRGGPVGAVPARQPWHRRLRRVLWTRRWWLAGSAALLALAAIAWWRIATHPSVTAPPTRTGPAGPAAATPAGAICPQDLPTDPVREVWAWVPVADDRPWVALGGGLLTLTLVGIAARRLRTAPRRWLPALDPGPGGDSAPRRGLPPLPVRGDLLLTPAARRELVWSIDRYVSEDPDRALDPEATVAATARAAGEPRLVQRRRTFPRQVWLWCDRKTARPETLERLVLEVRRALEQANLPVRIARFHGLPGLLVWEDSREPFAPGCHEAAGAQAVVAVLTDGAALSQAWEGTGERPRLEPLLRELRAWPRLLLVDLGEGELTRLAAGWRLAVRGPDALAAWLAGRAAEPAPLPQAPPDPAQLDLWAAACLLGPGRPDRIQAHAEAERLRRAMGLKLRPFDYGHLAARLDQCASEPGLAAALIARLARSQPLDDRGLPQGDGFLARALGFWERRLADGLKQLPADDAASRARLEIASAELLLWRDPEGAAQALARIGGRRNRALIRGALEGREPGVGRGPTWDWHRLPVAVRYRLRALGLGGRTPDRQFRLRTGSRHHLALAALAGLAVASTGWGLVRLLLPHQGAAVFSDPRFLAHIVEVDQAGRTWLGSPWRLNPLAALGPLDTPYTWEWQPAPNPQPLGGRALLLTGGTRAFPIRACTPNWPRRSLAIVAADRDDPGARKLAIRLLDRGAADRVLIAPDWQGRIADLTQGIAVPDDQLIVFLPPSVPAADPRPASPLAGDGRGAGAGPAADPLAKLAGRFQALAEVRGDLAALAAGVDFPGVRQAAEVWPDAAVRVLAGQPQVSGGPEVETDGFGVTWVGVCGGTFLMGSPESEDAHIDEYAKQWVDAFGGALDEQRNTVRSWLARGRPRLPVLVDDLWMARNELTQGQQRAAGGRADGQAEWPLASLNWEESVDACGRLGAALPSEAQWEYAARAGTATRWSFGEDPARMADYAWLRDNSEIQVHPVGQKIPNGLCLADIHGNVMEWVADCYDEQVYGSRGALTIDPSVDQSGCDSRVVRGGSFDAPPFILRSAGRSGGRPDDGYDTLGLRCVRSRARQP